MRDLDIKLKNYFYSGIERNQGVCSELQNPWQSSSQGERLDSSLRREAKVQIQDFFFFQNQVPLMRQGHKKERKSHFKKTRNKLDSRVGGKVVLQWTTWGFLSSVLVIYCCITNCSKVSHLKQQTFIFSYIFWESGS